MTANEKAFLDMLAWAEIGPQMLANSEDGYNVLAGSLPDMIITFSSYHRHPGVLLDMDGKPGGLESTAAGRYQIMGRIWKAYKGPLKLRGFWPDDQIKIAMQLINECGALAEINAGRIRSAIDKVRSRWASMPGAGYGQHEQRIDELLREYVRNGGTLENYSEVTK